MHGGLQSLFGGGNGDQLKTLYTNLGSANNQVQLKYITGQGLLSPLIIRASDLGLAPDQEQLHALPEFLNEFNGMNQPGGGPFMMRPGKQPFQRPDVFADFDAGLMKKRKKKRKKRPIFKFNEQDSMEFPKPNSMEFNRHNSMEFPSMNDQGRPRLKKQRSSFEKSYDDLVNSAKKLADTIENSADNDEINLDNDHKEKKASSSGNFESDKFNFDDEMKMSSKDEEEMKMSSKDEDELDNLEKLENLSGFGGGSSAGVGAGGKKNMNVDSFRDDFDSIEKSLEKNTFSANTDNNDKFGDIFNNEKFSDLFSEKEGDNEGDDVDKLYDKIISTINGGGKKGDKYGAFNENMFEDNKKTKGKKSNKKKPEPTPDPNAETDEAADEPANGNKEAEQDDLKANAENEQTEYNTNNSGHTTTETGEYDYAGYAKDPNEQSEEVTESPDGDKAPDKEPDKGQGDGGKYQDENSGSPPGGSDGGKYDGGKYDHGGKYSDNGKYSEGGKYSSGGKYSNGKHSDGKYSEGGKYTDNGKYADEQPTGPPPPDNREPENYNSNYKEQPSGDGEYSGNGERSFQPFTRLSVRKKSVRNPINKPVNQPVLNRFGPKDRLNSPRSTSNKPIGSNQFADGRTTKVVRVRSKRVRGESNSVANLIRFPS